MLHKPGLLVEGIANFVGEINFPGHHLAAHFFIRAPQFELINSVHAEEKESGVGRKVLFTTIPHGSTTERTGLS